MYPSYW